MSLFYLYSVKISKSSGSCSNIDDPYAKLKSTYVKVLSQELMKQDKQNSMKLANVNVDWMKVLKQSES